MRRVFIVTLMGTVLFACERRMSRQQRAVERQVLQGLVAAWARQLNNQNVDSLADLYLQDAALTVTWAEGQRAAGWQEQATLLRELFGRVATLNLVVQDPQIDVLDAGVALVTFRYSTDRILRTNERDVFSGFGTMVWTPRPSDGAWRIRSVHWSRTPSGPTAQRLSEP